MTERRKPEIADIDEDPNVEIGAYSSPPCYAHEVDPAYFGLPAGKGDEASALRRTLRAVEETTAVLTSLGAEG
jgi:hypothetical protein